MQTKFQWCQITDSICSRMCYIQEWSKVWSSADLTLEEFSMHQTVKCKWIISCINHKTGAKGRARLILDKNDFDHLNDYYKLVRQCIIPKEGCEKYFFLTYQGSQYKQVYRKILESICVNRVTVTMPPPSKDHRAVISTKTAKVKNDAKRRKVNRHLCHSDTTSANYYEFTNNDDAIKAHSLIQRISGKIKARRKAWLRSRVHNILV